VRDSTRFRGRLVATPVVRVTAGILLACTLLAVLGPVVSPHDPVDTGFDRILDPPSLRHWFGTDNLGRDLFVRTLSGMRTTLAVAVVASIVSLVIGVLYGAISGYLGGRVDAVMMRVVDTLYALPFIFLVILLMVAFERNYLLIFVAIGAVNWLDMARIVRGQTLSLKEREFVQAARLIGVPAHRIILRHIAPNLLGVVVVYLTLTIPQAVLVESFLSFLGLGVQEPATSLGTLVANGVGVLETAPWLLAFPSAVLFVVLLSFNFLGDGLRDAADVRHVRVRLERGERA
jgi:oligopeptide transport system permease protein